MWEFKEFFPFWLNLISEFDLISYDKKDKPHDGIAPSQYGMVPQDIGKWV